MINKKPIPERRRLVILLVVTSSYYQLIDVQKSCQPTDSLRIKASLPRDRPAMLASAMPRKLAALAANTLVISPSVAISTAASAVHIVAVEIVGIVVMANNTASLQAMARTVASAIGIVVMGIVEWAALDTIG
jgi:hypothetical protein